MAKTFGAVLGKQSGTIGQIVGRITNGKQFYAARPAVKGERPLTPKEVDARLKFKLLTALSMGMAPALHIGLGRFKNIEPYVSPRAYFSRINKDVVAVSGGTSEIDYGQIEVARGPIPEVGFGTCDFEEPLTVKVPFTANTDIPGASANDEVYIYVYEPESNRGVLSHAAQRSDASVEVALPSTWSGLTVHVYGFVHTMATEQTLIAGLGYNPGEKACSNSAYVGTGNVG